MFEKVLRELKYHEAGVKFAKVVKGDKQSIPLKTAIGGASQMFKSFAMFEDLGLTEGSFDPELIKKAHDEIKDFSDDIISQLSDKFDNKSFEFLYAAMFQVISTLLDLEEEIKNDNSHQCTKCGKCGKKHSGDSRSKETPGNIKPNGDIHVVEAELTPQNIDEVFGLIKNIMSKGKGDGMIN